MRRFVTAAILATICVVGPGAAQESPPAFKDFTFKRLKPPKSGSGPKITVQVDPTVDVFASAPDGNEQVSADVLLKCRATGFRIRMVLG